MHFSLHLFSIAFIQIIFFNFSFELPSSFWHCFFVVWNMVSYLTVKFPTIRTCWYFSFAISICSAIVLYNNFSPLFDVMFSWGPQMTPILISCFWLFNRINSAWPTSSYLLTTTTYMVLMLFFGQGPSTNNFFTLNRFCPFGKKDPPSCS